MTEITAEEDLHSALSESGGTPILEQDNQPGQRGHSTPGKSRKAKPPAPRIDESTNTVWI